ncbi:MAG: hypothetical protein IJS54_05170 [Desulfovibrio sp.]|nr:hypothetical protein [Desulfovibrio sp.]
MATIGILTTDKSSCSILLAIPNNAIVLERRTSLASLSINYEKEAVLFYLGWNAGRAFCGHGAFDGAYVFRMLGQGFDAAVLLIE